MKWITAIAAMAALTSPAAANAALLTLDFDGYITRHFADQDPLNVIGWDAQNSPVTMTATMTVDTSKLDVNTFFLTDTLDGPSLTVQGAGTDWITSLDVHIGNLHFTRSADPLSIRVGADQPKPGTIEGGIFGLELAPAYGYESLSFDLRELRFCSDQPTAPNVPCTPLSDPEYFDLDDPVSSLLGHVTNQRFGGFIGDPSGLSLGIYFGTWTNVTTQVPEPGTLGLLALGALGLLVRRRTTAVDTTPTRVG